MLHSMVTASPGGVSGQSEYTHMKAEDCTNSDHSSASVPGSPTMRQAAPKP